MIYNIMYNNKINYATKFAKRCKILNCSLFCHFLYDVQTFSIHKEISLSFPILI